MLRLALVVLLMQPLLACGQRLLRERMDSVPRIQYSRYDAIICTRLGEILATGYNQNPGDGCTRRLFTSNLDTVWTHHRYNYIGWQELRQPPQGVYLGLGLVINAPYTGGGPQSGQDVLLEKMAPDGRIQWSRSFDFNHSAEFGQGLSVLPSGWLLVTVLTGNPGRQRTYTLLTDNNGQEIWRRPYGWGGNEQMGHMQTSVTGRILAAGYSVAGPGPAQLKLLLFDARGDSVRGCLLAPLGPGRDARTQDGRNALLPLADGGWLLTGYRDTTGAAPDQPFVLRLDSLLQLRWAAPYRPPAGADVVYGGACELRDGSLLVLAWQRRPRTAAFALHRYAATGQLTHVYPLQSAVGAAAVAPYLLAPAPDGRTLYAAGFCDPTGTAQQSYLAAIDLQTLPGALVLGTPAPAAPAATLALFPNPANGGAVTLRYTLPAVAAGAEAQLYDVTGRLVRQIALPAGRGDATAMLSVTDLAPGLYACTLLVEGQRLATQKLVVAGL